MKRWLYLFVFIFSSALVNAQESHPPQNRGAEGMFYWSESQNKYVRGEDAMINVQQYGSMWGASNMAVVNYLTGKVFTRKTNGKGNEYAKCEFIGMDAPSTDPFNYNPYPNARDFAGNPWNFPQNRMRVILRTNDNQTDTCFVYEVQYLQNGAAKLTYFQKGGVNDRYWFLFKVDPSKNSGLESYLGYTENGFYKIEDNFLYGITFSEGTSKIAPNCIISYKSAGKVDMSNFKLSEVLEENSVLQLEFNSTVGIDRLSNFEFNAQITSKKAMGFGKPKIVKGKWTVSSDKKSLNVTFDDGTKKSYTITKLNSGYIQEIQEKGTNKTLTLSQVDKL
jgi:hypothetical protein